MPKLPAKRITALRRERDKLLGELSDLRLLVRGTYLERFSTCSRPHCACHRGKRHGPRSYAVITREKRQKQVSVPQNQVEAVRGGIDQYHRLLEIVERVTSINLELMRGGVLE